jgi:hypothetical protein
MRGPSQPVLEFSLLGNTDTRAFRNRKVRQSALAKRRPTFHLGGIVYDPSRMTHYRPEATRGIALPLISTRRSTMSRGRQPRRPSFFGPPSHL